jgi:uncharacterized membrane protein YgcG
MDFMKTRNLQSLALTLTAVAAVTLLTAKAVAQDSPPPTAIATPATQPAPQLSYGVAEVVQLAHANVSEDVIVNYVQSSGNGYGLDANQILYLKQQGVSDRVINAMLNQRSRIAAAQTAPPQSSTASSAPTATVVTPTTPAPPVSSSSVYVIPDTQTYNYVYSYPYSYPYYYYYPYYGWYGWPVVSIGWGGYWGGYHGGYWGGWHGGGWHTGGGGWHGGGGGWHGGGGGWHGGGGGGWHH